MPRLALNTTLEDHKMHDPVETNLALQIWVQLNTWHVTCKYGRWIIIGDWNRIIIKPKHEISKHR